MVREHKEIARVHLVGHGQYLLRFLLQTLLATLVCLLISIPGALHVARRMQRSITAPLKALTEVALQRQPPAGPQGAGAGGQYRRAARAG